MPAAPPGPGTQYQATSGDYTHPCLRSPRHGDLAEASGPAGEAFVFEIMPAPLLSNFTATAADAFINRRRSDGNLFVESSVGISRETQRSGVGRSKALAARVRDLSRAKSVAARETLIERPAGPPSPWGQTSLPTKDAAVGPSP